MGLEPYQITKRALFGVVAQRLLRRRSPDGGYKGRIPISEFVMMDDAISKVILARGDMNEKSSRRSDASRAMLQCTPPRLDSSPKGSPTRRKRDAS